MVFERKPLVLKEELAKIVREASPKIWLDDAHKEIEAWRADMPGADRLQLTASLGSDERGLELRCDDGWGRTTGFALYMIERGSVRFYPGKPELLPNSTLVSEQAFIDHLLQVLRAKFAIHR